MMSSAAIVRVRDLRKSYGDSPALQGVSLDVPKGSLFGLIGPDGAGKSTLMRIVCTLEKAQGGEVFVMGLSTVADRNELRRAIGYMAQKFSLYEDLTVGENLEFFASLFGIRGRLRTQVMGELLDFTRLGDFVRRRAGQLSGGMKQKLALACTLIHKPGLILLDEPTVGVDPVTRRDFWEMLARLQENGMTALVSTPYMDEAAKCDHVLLLHEGRVLRQGSPRRLASEAPFCIFRIEGEASLHFSADAEPPGPIELLYPMGGFLHAALPTDFKGQAEQVLREVQAVLPEAKHCEPAPVTMEDLLLWELRSRDEGDR